MFTDIQSTTDWTTKCNLVQQLVNEVSVHSAMEERFLYPLIATKIPDDTLLLERMNLDNRISKELLSFFDKSKPVSASDRILFDITINKFVSTELDHMDNEEQVVLKALAESLTPEEKEQLEKDLRSAKSTAPTHPQDLPAFGGKGLHPLAAIVDKILDTTEAAPKEADKIDISIRISPPSSSKEPLPNPSNPSQNGNNSPQ